MAARGAPGVLGLGLSTVSCVLCYEQLVEWHEFLIRLFSAVVVALQL